MEWFSEGVPVEVGDGVTELSKAREAITLGWGLDQTGTFSHDLFDDALAELSRAERVIKWAEGARKLLEDEIHARTFGAAIQHDPMCASGFGPKSVCNCSYSRISASLAALDAVTGGS